MSDPLSRYLSSGLQHEKPEDPKVEPTPEPTFESELTSLINRYSKEAGSGTPDYILAAFLIYQIEMFDRIVQQRASWRGERIDATFDIKYDEKVKIVAYDEHGRRNEIGEAEVSVWPGETMVHGKIVGLKAIFESKPE